MRRGAGFFAVDRSIFDHWVARDPKRFKAWQWLIARAAFRPRGARGTWGVVHLERGQLIGTIRGLAHAWKWPKSNVARFLKRLAADRMIETKTGTLTGTPSGPRCAHLVTVITICSYDQFQLSAAGHKSKAGHQAGHPTEQARQQVLALPEFSEPLTINHDNKSPESKGTGLIGGQRKEERAPKHCQRSKRHGTIYVHRGTAEWMAYADDYRSVIGAEPLPDRFGGFWFCANGESTRPAHQRTWRNPNAYGQARHYHRPLDQPPKAADSS